MAPAHANWFVALEVPASPWFEAVPDPPPRFRRFAPGDLHLTVAFLGACGRDRALEAWAKRRDHPAIAATLGPVVPMGRPRRYSALSASLVEGREAAAGLIASLRGPMLAAADARRDDREPRPHITLARPKRKATAGDRQAGLAWAEDLGLDGTPVPLTSLALYTWSTDRADHLFDVVERAALTR